MQTLQVQLMVRPDPIEVGNARRWARARLAWCGIAAEEPSAEAIVMLVSELVTNAVVHTERPAQLRLSIPVEFASPGTYRVEVVDNSSRPPLRRQAQGFETHGRGLELVAGLADRWGWQPEGAGKLIWCEVDRGPARAPRTAEGAGADVPEGALFAGACEHARAVTGSS